MIDGYFVYCTCRRVMGRTRVKLESFLDNSEQLFYEMLAKSFKEEGFSEEDIKKYISVNHNKNPKAFQPYELLSSEYRENYEKWKRNLSTVPKYLDYVNKSFDYIENFCIKENISLKEYKQRYAKKHIRDDKIDGSVAIKLKLINKNRLSRVEKILLKKFLNEYNIIQIRMNHPKLKSILDKRAKETISMISTMKK